MTRCVLALAGLAFFTGACGGRGGEGPTGPTVSLAGSYILESFTQAGTTFQPPQATGNLTLTETRYDFTLNLPSEQIHDCGTYRLEGNVIFNRSECRPGSDFQGTYTFQDQRLTIETSALGGFTIVWLKMG